MGNGYAPIASSYRWIRCAWLAANHFHWKYSLNLHKWILRNIYGNQLIDVAIGIAIGIAIVLKREISHK